MRSCVEMCEPIELSLGEVSWVGPGICVLDRGQRAARGRGFWDFSGVFSPFV